MSSPNASTKGALPLPARREFKYAPPSDPLDILHRDEDMLIVDKPAGLLSVPGRELPDLVY
jgi:23S rRNA-/tRNA-specific pseudouridylate synthase